MTHGCIFKAAMFGAFMPRARFRSMLAARRATPIFKSVEPYEIYLREILKLPAEDARVVANHNAHLLRTSHGNAIKAVRPSDARHELTHLYQKELPKLLQTPGEFFGRWHTPLQEIGAVKSEYRRSNMPYFPAFLRKTPFWAERYGDKQYKPYLMLRKLVPKSYLYPPHMR